MLWDGKRDLNNSLDIVLKEFKVIDALIASLQPKHATLLFMSQDNDPRLPLQIRYRPDGVTILGSDLEEVGELDKHHADVLKDLQRQFPSLRCEVYVMQASFADAKKSSRSAVFSIELNVYGSPSLAESVGSVLSDANVYLQEPTYLPEIIAYRNPHVYSVDDDFLTPRFREKRCETKRNFECEIDAIIHETASTDPQKSFWQDPRIHSPLCK
jgi:hypothetical protein